MARPFRTKIRHSIKPEDSGAKGGGALVGLGPKRTNKGTFRKVIKGLLGMKALISSLEEPTCPHDLEYLTEKIKVEQASERENPEVTHTPSPKTSLTYCSLTAEKVELAG